MSTLAIMKARIADELARSDLTTQIAYAITDAITAYEDNRWFFNESRAITFTTVANQEFYTAANDPGLASIQKLDYVVVYVGGYPHKLRYERPAEAEHLSVSSNQTGTPWAYTWYGEAIRLYPIPDQPYTVRIGASVKIAPPASDATTGNPWMTHAERLIRSRAKLELALHVLMDVDLAATMTEGVNEAFVQLRNRTNQLTQAESGRVRAWDV